MTDLLEPTIIRCGVRKTLWTNFRAICTQLGVDEKKYSTKILKAIDVNGAVTDDGILVLSGGRFNVRAITDAMNAVKNDYL